MRYLLVAADKSSQLPIEIPDEILTHKAVSKAKSGNLKTSQKKVKRLSTKSRPKKKRNQIAKPIAK